MFKALITIGFAVLAIGLASALPKISVQEESFQGNIPDGYYVIKSRQTNNCIYSGETFVAENLQVEKHDFPKSCVHEFKGHQTKEGYVYTIVSYAVGKAWGELGIDLRLKRLGENFLEQSKQGQHWKITQVSPGKFFFDNVKSGRRVVSLILGGNRVIKLSKPTCVADLLVKPICKNHYGFKLLTAKLS